jgi:hypothetical protein
MTFKVGDKVHFEHWRSDVNLFGRPWIVNGTITAINPRAYEEDAGDIDQVIVDDSFILQGYDRLRVGHEEGER